MLKRRFAEPVVVAALLALLGGLLVSEAWGDSLTYDEGRYIRSGYCAVQRGLADVEPANPLGFKLLGGLGLALFHPGRDDSCAGRDYRHLFDVPPAGLRRMVFAARLPAVALTLLGVLLAFAWARSMLGRAPALLTLSLLATEPNLLGHGHLVTGDVPLAVGALGCLAAHWRWSETRRHRWLFVSGVAVGFALLSKASALYLLPILGAIGLVQWRLGRSRAVQVLSVPAFIAGVAWLTMCAAYLPFRDPLAPPGVAAMATWLAPPSFIHGLRFQFTHVAAGATYNYLNGEVRVGRGFWSYFLEALLLKSTLGMLALSVFALVVTARSRLTAGWLYLWLPALVVLAAATLGGIDIGVRYLMPLYPLLAVAAGIPLASAAVPRRRRTALAVSTLVVLAATSSLLHTPGHIGYFNELAGSRPERYLADSNLDWGQDAWRLRDRVGAGSPLRALYFGALPLASYGIEGAPLTVRDSPSAGPVAASLTELTSYGPEASGYFAALRACAGRVTRVGTSILLVPAGPPGPCP
ncbi:MAG: glycosyltransferase family 39 protein [Candidatus Dormibacteria bacterium]